MKIQFLTEYYFPFLDGFYSTNTNYNELSYSTLLQLLLDKHFADTGAAHFHFNKHGHLSNIIIANCEPLQKKWAIENNVAVDETQWKTQIALAQIKLFRPDVFFIESIFSFYGAFLKEANPYCKIIASWISTPYSNQLPLNNIDVIFSSTPDFVETFKNLGIKSYYLLPGFDERVLQKINYPQKKSIPLSFVGGWSDVHINRKKVLTELAGKTPLKIWGYGYKNTFSRKTLAFYKNYFFPKNSQIIKSYQQEVWGLSMYDILQKSLITLNVHEALLNGNVGNMRMFEASGVGTMILTDYGHNLHTLFEAEKEIESYKSINEAKEKIKFYLSNPEKCITIGINAQKRTLRDYNYSIYTQNLTNYLIKLL